MQDSLAGQGDAAGSGHDEPGEGLEEGRLAAAGRTDNANEIAGAEGQIDGVERMHRPFLRRVLDAEFGEFDEGFGHVPDKLLPHLQSQVKTVAPCDGGSARGQSSRGNDKVFSIDALTLRLPPRKPARTMQA